MLEQLQKVLTTMAPRSYGQNSTKKRGSSMAKVGARLNRVYGVRRSVYELRR